jgi:hypothetical protein
VLGTQTYAGDANTLDGAYGVTVDADGNLLVAAYISTVSTGRDAWVRKYRR